MTRGNPQEVLAAIVALVPECVSPLRERGMAAPRRTESVNARNPGDTFESDWPAAPDAVHVTHAGIPHDAMAVGRDAAR
jgi:hypothetical protein